VFRTESGEKAVSVQEGRERLMLCSSQRGDHELTEYLMSDPLSVHVHESCLKQYVNVPMQQVKRPAVIDGVQETGKVKFMRSGVDTFDWKRNCFLCGKLAVRDERRPTARTRVREAKTDKVMETILRLCEERQNNWSFEVKGRLLTCGDLHAADGVYHVNCHREFCHPKSADSVNVSAGR